MPGKEANEATNVKAPDIYAALRFYDHTACM